MRHIVPALIIAAAALAVQAPSAVAAAPERGAIAAAACGEGRCARAAGGRRAALRAIANSPAAAVIINLRAIERVYRSEGRDKDLPAFYREQLTRTEDPLVRNFVHYRIARLEMRDDDAAAALEALQRNLVENYGRLGARAGS
jgi:hypothetical protein